MGLKSRCHQGCAPFRGCRGESPLLCLFPFSSSFLYQHLPLACGYTSPVSVLRSPCLLLLCVCVQSPSISLSWYMGLQSSSVQFSCSVMSDLLRPHGLQHARPPCPSPTPGDYSNLCPLCRWCYPTISSSVVPFSCPQSLPASGLVLHSRWPKYWSFSFSISPSNEYSGLISFRMDWLDLLAVQGAFKSLLQHHNSKHQFFGTQLSL